MSEKTDYDQALDGVVSAAKTAAWIWNAASKKTRLRFWVSTQKLSIIALFAGASFAATLAPSATNTQNKSVKTPKTTAIWKPKRKSCNQPSRSERASAAKSKKFFSLAPSDRGDYFETGLRAALVLRL
jgi:hypothetical protein